VRNGFTLIEMLVALAVFSLAALALLRLEGATLANTRALDDRLLGQIVARNVAVETLTDPAAPSLGVGTGEQDNGGRLWRWTRTTAAMEQASLVRVDIAVSDDSGDPVAALTIVRPVS
jgi:general secretion pathway protein I